MAVTQTRSMQGETVDLICHRVYGDTAMTAAVLDANPGLGALGPILPAGTLVLLPPKQAPAPARRINLWD